MSQRKQENKLAPFNASRYRVGIVVAQFNADITEKLLAAALAEAQRYHIPKKNITVHHVAGSVEMPVVLRALARTKKYNALVALGAIVRGETAHFEYVAKIVSEGVLAVMMENEGMPVGFGVLTCETVRQAEKRMSVGAGALAAAVHNARILDTIRHGAKI